MDWYRRYHGTCADPKFRLVARAAKVPTPFAGFAWDAVLEYASSNTDDRGSAKGFTAELLAVTIDIAEDEAGRLLAEFRRRGMITSDGRVAAWEKRQRINWLQRKWDANRRLRRAILERDGEVCTYCGTLEGPFEIDHAKPRSRGGSDDPSNLVVACVPCNRAKGTKTVDEWLARTL